MIRRRGALLAAIALPLLTACGPASTDPAAPSTPADVRVDRWQGHGRDCLVFLHDSEPAGVSIAVDCVQFQGAGR